jgi:hypothetical protein
MNERIRNAQILLSELTRRGVSLTPNGDRLTVDDPRGALTHTTVEVIRRHKPELLELLQGKASAVLLEVSRAPVLFVYMPVDPDAPGHYDMMCPCCGAVAGYKPRNGAGHCGECGAQFWAVDYVGKWVGLEIDAERVQLVWGGGNTRH